jgi:predicted nuclease of restriction endonuclease-like (RecB) superfamily
MGIDKKKRKQLGKEKEQIVFPIAESLENIPKSYLSFIKNLKERIVQQRLKTVLSANADMILMYWDIWVSILKKQANEGWGTKVIDRMSFDLKKEFPSMKGFSPRNLKYMRKFAETWTDFEIVQRIVAQIPWRSNIHLCRKLKTPNCDFGMLKKTFGSI